MRASEFIKESMIKIGAPSQKALAWIDKVYGLYPHTFQNNHVMVWGEGKDQQFAMFELVPSMSKKDAVEVKWFQAYPLRQGVGSRAMAELQRLAKEDGIALTLYPWDKGQVSQAKLMKFYKGHGFKPTSKGSKNMYWEPEQINESSSITLSQLYDGNFPDRDEIFWDYVSNSELNKPLSIQTMPKHKLLITLLSQYRVEHIDEITDMLDDEQQEIIQKYMNDPNLSSSVIVVSNDRIIDGNHRALSAALSERPIRFVDLSDLD